MKAKYFSAFGALSLVLACGTAHADFNSGFGGSNQEIVGGSTVDANDPIASTTVLLYGEIDAVATQSESAQGLATQGRKKPPTNPPANTTPPADSAQPAAPKVQHYICTASIIAPDTLVTAAHCVTAAPDKLKVIFSRNVANTPGQPPVHLDPSQVLSITGYLANPNYKGEEYAKTGGNDMGDIAVIHLAGPLPAGYQAAELLTDPSVLSPKALTVLAGYGITSAKGQQGAGTLRKVIATIGGPAGQTEVVIDETNGKGSCSGDSGGPAYMQSGSHLLLWGVTSRGDMGCAVEGVYTRIDAYSAWVSQAAQTLRNN